MKTMKKFIDSPNFRKVARVFLIVGGLNRGLMGLFNFDVVALIFGYGFFARVIYTIVGLSTVHILLYPKNSVHSSLRK